MLRQWRPLMMQPARSCQRARRWACRAAQVACSTPPTASTSGCARQRSWQRFACSNMPVKCRNFLRLKRCMQTDHRPAVCMPAVVPGTWLEGATDLLRTLLSTVALMLVDCMVLYAKIQQGSTDLCLRCAWPLQSWASILACQG